VALRVIQAAWTACPELLEAFLPTAEQLARVLGSPERAELIRDDMTSRLGPGTPARHAHLVTVLGAFRRLSQAS